MHKKLVIVVGLLSVGISGYAAETKAPVKIEDKKTVLKDGPLTLEQVKNLQDNLRAYDAVYIKFSQSIFKNLRKKTITNQGEAYFKKPDKFRWVLTAPNAEEWVFDGEDLLNYFPGKNEAIRYGAKATKGRNLRELVDIILNFKQLLAKYKLDAANKKGDLVVLQLTPLEASDVEKIEVDMGIQVKFIKTLKMSFKGGNTTTLSFLEPSFKVFPEDKFSLAKSIKITNAL